MKTLILTFFAIILLVSSIFAQQNKVNVFYDCQSTWKCRQYYDYIRTEIKMVNFVSDRFASDVHLQITEQSVGGNGSKFYFNFLGRNRFEKENDTLSFVAQGTATDDEIRKDFVKSITIGLVKYVLKTDMAKYLSVKFDAPKDSAKITKDRWNYWVYSVGGSVNASGDANYSSSQFYGNLSASRVTEKEKISFWLGKNQSNSTYRYGTELIKVNNKGMDMNTEYTKAINEHWSIGADVEAEQNTFRNFKFRGSAMPKIEYSVFPYKDFNAKRIVVGYSVGAQENRYFDTTLYLKTREFRGKQTIYVNSSFTQKWGNINIGLDWSNYLHDINLNKLGIGGAVEWRVVEGLKLAFFGNYEFIRNQIYLPKGNATKDEVITKQRSIGSSFNYWTGAGIRYQFGSRNNSAVNSRFNGLNYSISF